MSVSLLTIPTMSMPRYRIGEGYRAQYLCKVWDNVNNKYLPKDHPRTALVNDDALVQIGRAGHMVRLAALGNPNYHVLVEAYHLDDARVGSILLA